MSEHDDSLQKAVEEGAGLRSEREAPLREVASTEFSSHLRSVERVYWLCGVACVALGAAAVNFFVRSFAVKTLIGCAVVLLVLYETAMLMRLWFDTAAMKLSVLKEMKLLRLEVARVATAAGVEKPSEPPARYEPMGGVPAQERSFWLAACVGAVVLVSALTSMAWFGGGDAATDTLVTLAADGSAEKRRERVQDYTGYHLPTGFSLYAPKDWNVRLLDSVGHEMPIEVVGMDTQNRHDVTFTDSVFGEGKMRYTEVFEIPKAATLEDGVWTYQEGMRIAGREQEYSITILLPATAKLLSADPTADVEVDEDGRTQLRYQGTTIDDKQYLFTIRYEMPSSVD